MVITEPLMQANNSASSCLKSLPLKTSHHISYAQFTLDVSSTVKN